MGTDNEYENVNNPSSDDSSIDNFDSDNNSELSGYEEEESSSSEGTSEVDYTDLLTNIDGNIDDITAQINVVNENITVLNENIKLGISLLLVIVFFLLIKCAYHIIGSVLGLNKA